MSTLSGTVYLVCCTWLLSTIICLSDTCRKTHAILLSRLPSWLFFSLFPPPSQPSWQRLHRLYSWQKVLTEREIVRESPDALQGRNIEYADDPFVFSPSLLPHYPSPWFPLIIPHPGWFSPQSWQGAGRPAASWRRGAHRGWGGWERRTGSSFVRSPQRLRQGRALHSSRRKPHDDLQGPLRGQRKDTDAAETTL